jgi:hypothetical protein
MLVERTAGLGAVRLGEFALPFGSAVSLPLFDGAAFGILACGALAGDPQIDDFSHCQARWLRVHDGLSADRMLRHCADTVASVAAGISTPTRMRTVQQNARHGSVNESREFNSNASIENEQRNA